MAAANFHTMNHLVETLIINSNVSTTLRPNVHNKYEKFYNMAQFTTGLIGYPIAGVLGIVGSILCIVVLNRKNMRTSTNSYLTALAVADLLKLLNDFMYFPTMIFQYYGYKEQFGILFAHYYPYAFFLSQYSAGCAAWLTVSVAFERFLMVVHPTWSRHQLTINKARVSALMVYIINLIFNFPFFMKFQRTQVCTSDNSTQHDNANSTISPLNVTLTTTVAMSCSPSIAMTQFWNGFTWSHTYTMIHGCMRSIIPLLILIVLNARIVFAVRQTRANKRLTSRNRVTVMLVVVIACCIFLATPDAIMTLMGYGYADETSNFRKGVREITDLLLCINSVVNFFLYMAFNRVFLQNFLWLCKEKKECWIFDEKPQSLGRTVTRSCSSHRSTLNTSPQQRQACRRISNMPTRSTRANIFVTNPNSRMSVSCAPTHMGKSYVEESVALTSEKTLSPEVIPLMSLENQKLPPPPRRRSSAKMAERGGRLAVPNARPEKRVSYGGDSERGNFFTVPQNDLTVLRTNSGRKISHTSQSPLLQVP